MGGVRRSFKEAERLVREYERSGLGRREYCERRGIPLGTLDWYRWRVRAGHGEPALLPVRLTAGADPATGASEHTGFTLVLGNGRRIESSWRFDDGALERLIRIAGAA